MASSILRFRKLCLLVPTKCSPYDEKKQLFESQKIDHKEYYEKPKKKLEKKFPKEWRCIDSCCWMIGYLCTIWWLLLFLYHCLPMNLSGLQGPEPPGARLSRHGVSALHPVVLVPGIVTGGLELWEGRACSEGLFRQRLWGGSFTQVFKRPMCWLEHLSLDNETGLDPPGIRVRAVPGLVAADYFAPGYFVWAILIENLARIGYEGKNMYMAAYDWRLSFQNTESILVDIYSLSVEQVRDQTLSRLKSKIELMYMTNGNKKVVVVPHSMGVIYFLHFMKWVEAPPPMGGGGGPDWCAKHIKSIMNIGPAFLGVPKAVSNVLSAESKDVAFIRAMAPGLLDSEIFGLQALDHVMHMSRTWDSIISLLPKGGDTIWGGLDWSPEEDHVCESRYKKQVDVKGNNTDGRRGFQVQESTNYGRVVTFGKKASELHSSEFSNLGSEKQVYLHNATTSQPLAPCGKVWTEYEDVSPESIWRISQKKAYTANTLLELIRSIAPKMMKRAEAHFSHGIADNLDDPKYDHYKYWSNPLETKLPDAPDIEIYCLYGVGIPTERSYVYKVSSSGRCKNIPLRIDSSADGGPNGCLKGGVHFTDGDESVPVLSAGFMCAKGWRGKTRFNPAGMATHVREYKHKAPANFLEGRGLESGGHVDIMGNVALIEDVLRVAAGATGAEIGGDRIYSDIMKMSNKIKIRL
ncbi:putative phospholipid:diacylglycerol acyltransferase 2 [Phtheirospermum japonicum]|uniref:Putative phospholipid:diacylglycerol acyltransferase 2 n=1 Tax=Phtheirospermum japonicum TaxID=374723 RepID=A0A830C7W5_9LAMI|nr:putative phospholipid:diacylglycerol acyltransferase 2 [Phtheirospermum japonicum]